MNGEAITFLKPIHKNITWNKKYNLFVYAKQYLQTNMVKKNFKKFASKASFLGTWGVTVIALSGSQLRGVF